MNLEYWRFWLEVFRSPQPALIDSWCQLLEKMRAEKVYRPRKAEVSTSTLGSKLSDMSFFLMVYNDTNSHVISEYGKLFLLFDQGSLEESKVVATSMLETPLPNPASTFLDCNLYPVRLIFWLLLNNSLSKKLFADEIAFVLFWYREINDINELVTKILEWRKLSNQKKIDVFESLDIGSDSNKTKYGWKQSSETKMADITHQISYLKKALIGANLIQVTSGNELKSFIHGNPKAKTKTKRKLSIDKWELNDRIIPFISEAFNYIDPCDKPLEDYEELLNGNCYSLYNKLPDYLSESLNVEVSLQAAEKKISYLTPKSLSASELRSLSSLMITNSRKGGDGVDFEYTIRDFFNVFDDCSAERIGNSGNTDVLIRYNKLFLFTSDGKSMSGGQATGIPSTRIRAHLKKHKANYCWVVAPGFSPGAIRDIQGFRIVGVRADTLSMLMRTWLALGITKVLYSEFDSIVQNSLGSVIDFELRNYIKNISSKSAA